jgi:excisionase family DNA binding protein
MPEYSGVEAAAKLGVSIDTIKRMVKRGELRGFKDAGGRWRVHIDEAPTVEHRLHLVTGEEDDHTPSHDVRAPTELLELRARLEATEALVTELRAGVEAYRKQVEADAVERAELRRLLSTALQRPQLPAAVEGEIGEGAGGVPSKGRRMPADAQQRPWWRFWARA